MIEPSSFSTSSQSEIHFLSSINSHLHQCKTQFNNDTFKEKALSVIPMEELFSRAEAAFKNKVSGSPFGYEDFLVKELLSWFKYRFFKWVDAPPCQHCNSKTIAQGGVMPNAEEKKYLAGRVELYRCSQCQGLTRFPRYNHSAKLLETRQGRCGEWAQCFTLCCAALGFKARYVLDWTDHVWTEVFSAQLGRWIHCDPCENAFDSPMMYEAGWSKNLSYVIAFSHEEVVDVTKRYTRKWNDVVTRRTKVSEEWLSKTLNLINMQLDIFKHPDDVKDEKQRRENEQNELNGYHILSPSQNFKPEEMQGRISGSQEWKESRGETGSTSKQISASYLQIPYDPNYAQKVESKMTQIVNIKKFDDNEQSLFQLIKDAIIQGNQLNITMDKPDQVGAAWLKDPIDISPMSIVFQFKIQKSSGGQGADGFAFVIQKQSNQAIGSGGCDLGYAGIVNALAIEFDTYQTTDRNNDPSGNHIAIMSSNPSLPAITSNHQLSQIAYAEPPIHLADGKTHTVKIFFFEKKLFLFLDKMDQPILSCELKSQIHGVYYLGFTGSCGGLSEQHSILSLSVSKVLNHFPTFNHRLFEVGNVAGIEKKITEFNQKQTNNECKLNDGGLVIVKQLLLGDKSLKDEKQYEVLEKMMKWEDRTLFPVLDLLRILVLSSHNLNYFSKAKSLLDPLLKRFETIAVSYANDMLFYRLLSNMFKHNNLLMLEHYSQVLDLMSKRLLTTPTDQMKSGLRLGYSSLLHNYVLSLSKPISKLDIDVAEAKIFVANHLIDILKKDAFQKDLDLESLYVLLVSAGSLIKAPENHEGETGEIIQFFIALDSEKIFNHLISTGHSSKVADVCKDLQKLISQ